ncbi:MAG: aspartate/glutamate racemase family protein [Synergistetes bacterium]|nr:aspartate/glutamate racemase family protein [Synergistota bacterium]MCX8127398.1 aspartate/glutamate racemase family protein [Synergistota bacterium]MDW8192262.1 aspartate/glutamate racemase family protein [Synergistota bacterium]
MSRRRVLLITPGEVNLDDILKSYDTISIEVKPLSEVPSVVEDTYGLAQVVSNILGVLKSISKLYDAIVISCFEDLGLDLPKKVGVPVISLSDVSLISGSLHGRRFSILAPNHYIASLIYRRILEKGLAPSLASIRVVRSASSDVFPFLLAEARKAIEEDCAEAIVLGYPAWRKFSEVLSKKISVPIIEPLSKALSLIEVILRKKEVEDAH